mgnify:CR=1 FL=1
MGHIELAAPVSHIWYFKGIPSRMGTILDISPRLLEQVLYFVSYIVTDPGSTPLSKNQILTEREYRDMREKYEGDFDAGMGAEAVQKLLADIDLAELSVRLRENLKGASGQKKIKLVKRLEVVDAFLHSGNRLKVLDPLFRREELDIRQVLVGLMSSRGRDLMTAKGREADSVYFVPDLRAWFVESTMYPFIGGDTVGHEEPSVPGLTPAVNLILPYAFPAFLATLVWKGMLNTDFGLINQVFLRGVHIPWLTDGLLAKFSILGVNLWLGFPYMFLVCLGACSPYRATSKRPRRSTAPPACAPCGPSSCRSCCSRPFRC